jgi:hypothetical protein
MKLSLYKDIDETADDGQNMCMRKNMLVKLRKFCKINFVVKRLNVTITPYSGVPKIYVKKNS